MSKFPPQSSGQLGKFNLPKSTMIKGKVGTENVISNNQKKSPIDFSPAYLFAAGEQGVWFDNSNTATMFQDIAGTQPITAIGQPVGKQLDLSGNGNHRVAANNAQRPVFNIDSQGKGYLQYDGVDDQLATAATVNFTGTSKASVFIGFQKDADNGSPRVICELSPDEAANPGAFICYTDAAGAWTFLGGGTLLSGTSVAGVLGVQAVVFTGVLDITAPLLSLGVNKGVPTGNAGPQGVGPMGNYKLYFGSRAGPGIAMLGKEYQNIVRGAASSAAETLKAQNWIIKLMGLPLLP